MTEPCVSEGLRLLPPLPTPLSILPPLEDEEDPCINRVLVSGGAAGWYPIATDDVRTIVVAVATTVATPPATDDDDVIVDGDICELVAVEMGERAELCWLSAGEDS